MSRYTGDLSLTVRIYQLKKEKEFLLFRPYDSVIYHHGKIDPNNYALVYEYTDESCPSLDDIWDKFNLALPEDYKGHSLSVSDVIMIIDPLGNEGAYYVDDFGFKSLEDFIPKE